MAEYTDGVALGSQAAYHRCDGCRLACGIESCMDLSACAVPKRRIPLLSWAFAVRSDSSAVFVDQASDGLSTVDPGGHVGHKRQPR